MYKVLIVDDEPFILDGLKYIINWEDHGLEIAAQAYSASEALALMDITKFNIMITDIKMPDITGLELIEQARSKNENMKFIVLSGYDDFQYLKQAVKLDIENYLLKPVNPDDLSSTLLNTIDKIESEYHKRTREREGLNTLKNNVLFRLVTNSISKSELLDKVDMLGLNLESPIYITAIIKILSDSSDNCTKNSSEKSMLCFSVNNIVGELVASYRVGVTFYDLNDNTIILFYKNTVCPDYELVRQLLQNAVENINKLLNINVFITIGSQENTYENISRSFSNARNLLDFLLVFPSNSVIDHSSICEMQKESQKDIVLNHELLRNLVASEKHEEVDRFIENAFKEVRNMQSIMPSYVRNMSIIILFNIIDAVKKINNYTNVGTNGSSEVFSRVFAFDTISELEQYIKLTVGKILRNLHSDSIQYSTIIKQVLSCVNLNYSSELSLKTLSYTLNVNAAYLGQQFKKEVGEIFTNYLIKHRVEKAKEYLLNTNLKSNEIAEKVGFTDTNYFYILFKKVTGVSPSEFKKSQIVVNEPGSLDFKTPLPGQ